MFFLKNYTCLKKKTIHVLLLALKQQQPFEKGFCRAGDLYEAGLVYHAQHYRILPTGRHLNFALHFKTFINFW